MSEYPSLFLVFAAGIVTAVNPCILPILPPMLAGSLGHRLRPLFIVMGLSLTFTLMGGVFSVVGIAAGAFRETLRLGASVLIILFGVVMVDREIGNFYYVYSSRIAGRFSGIFNKGTSRDSGLMSAFFLGASLGVVWIPCVGPILGAVLSYATYKGDLLTGSILLLVYSAGVSVSMLAMAYGGKYAGGKISWAKRNSELIRKLAGGVLIVAGVSILFGLDKYIQAILLPYFPAFL